MSIVCRIKKKDSKSSRENQIPTMPNEGIKAAAHRNDISTHYVLNEYLFASLDENL